MADLARKSLDDERYGGQPLLTVNDQWRFLVGDLREPLLYIDDGSDKVVDYALIATCAQNVLPKLLTILYFPRIGTLIDGDDTSVNLSQKLQ